jgi:hypothetical protein
MSTFEPGQWKAQCDRCGFWHKSRALRVEWNGLRVCGACWEPRHPQESLRGKADIQAPPWVRPATDGPDVTLETGTPVTEADL